MIYQGHLRFIVVEGGGEVARETPTMHLDGAIHGFTDRISCEAWAVRAFGAVVPGARVVATFLPMVDVFIPDGWSPTDRVVCPQCGEPARRRRTPFRQEGSILGVTDPGRLWWEHVDGEAMCSEMTSDGYQPSYPKGVV